MSEPTPLDGSALGAAPPAQPPFPGLPAPAGGTGGAQRPDGSLPPDAPWQPWTAPLALIGGLVLALVGGFVVDIPALALGANVTGSHTPPGLAIANTFVQDVAFVLAAIYCARLGGRTVRSWQLGLRPPAVGWRAAAKLILLLLLAFIVLSVLWTAAFHPSKEKLLEQLGSNEGSGLLVLSAALTCIVAPISEEILFRGYIFTALRNWRGTLPAALITGILFGAVHVGSAPALDLVPLAALGFGLCLLYERTRSLYPCFLAHSLNNAIAFAALESWSWQAPVLIVSALAGVGAVVWLAKRVGLIAPETSVVGSGA
ncbi:MAG: family intrarane metalloprotease [Solirubrobacterales bacterium]|jgi:membrane protease YdiL (CAAX protease family)|nr:family intrarane metalloprotease [Solirubrobacterales bacterium]